MLLNSVFVSYFVIVMMQTRSCWGDTDELSRQRAYASCKQIKLANSAAPSGEYSIRTSAGRTLDEVYCEMGISGGGFTFLNPFDLPSLTAAEIQALFTDKTQFLLRLRLTDGTQPYGVLRQLPQYSAMPLAVSLNSNTGYNTPVNVGYLGSNYLYFGFLNQTIAGVSGRVEGLQVNGISISFTNCDANPNSYFALFPDFSESLPTTYGYGQVFPMYNSILQAMKPNPSRRVISSEYFTFFESHFGGCGLYTQSDGRQAYVISAAIGFR